MTDEHEPEPEADAADAADSDSSPEGAGNGASADEAPARSAAEEDSAADEASDGPSAEDTPPPRRPGDTNGVSVAPADEEPEPSPLTGPLVEPDDPQRPYAYPIWLRLLMSAFVLYHASVLLVENLPSKGLSRGLQTWFNKKLKATDYFRATGNTQSWAMFAPNPHRSNIFMKVLVKDAQGEVYDLKHDIYGKRTYPYLFYDRMGKVNRRIIDQKGYRRHYAAWVCREWERTHDGKAADEVIFIKMWTKVPHPNEVIQRFKAKGYDLRYLGYNPLELKLNEREADTFRCATTRHAQLPNYLRRRYGLPEVDEDDFRGLNIRTWWEKQEQERRAAERQEQAEARAAARTEAREAGMQ